MLCGLALDPRESPGAGELVARGARLRRAEAGKAATRRRRGQWCRRFRSPASARRSRKPAETGSSVPACLAGSGAVLRGGSTATRTGVPFFQSMFGLAQGARRLGGGVEAPGHDLAVGGQAAGGAAVEEEVGEEADDARGFDAAARLVAVVGLVLLHGERADADSGDAEIEDGVLGADGQGGRKCECERENRSERSGHRLADLGHKLGRDSQRRVCQRGWRRPRAGRRRAMKLA